MRAHRNVDDVSSFLQDRREFTEKQFGIQQAGLYTGAASQGVIVCLRIEVFDSSCLRMGFTIHRIADRQKCNAFQQTARKIRSSVRIYRKTHHFIPPKNSFCHENRNHFIQ